MYQCITQSMHPTPCYMKLSLSWKKVIGSEVDAISHMEWYQDTDWEQSMHSRIQLQYKNLYLFLSNYIMEETVLFVSGSTVVLCGGLRIVNKPVIIGC